MLKNAYYCNLDPELKTRLPIDDFYDQLIKAAWGDEQARSLIEPNLRDISLTDLYENIDNPKY